MEEGRGRRDEHDGAAGLDEGAELALAVGAQLREDPVEVLHDEHERATAQHREDEPLELLALAVAPQHAGAVALDVRAELVDDGDNQVVVGRDLHCVLRDHDHREGVRELLVGAQPVDEQRQNVRLAPTARGDEQRVGAVAAEGGCTRALEQLVQDLPAPDGPAAELLRVRGRRRERDETRATVYGRHRSQARRTISELKRKVPSARTR